MLQVIWSEKIDRILSVGVWLGPEHRNWALTRGRALNAIDQLRDANVVILGGDVLSGPDESYRLPDLLGWTAPERHRNVPE